MSEVVLDQYQLNAVNCNDDRILCLAGAGAGKTECMIRRVNRLVKDGVNPESILVFTFTNVAAEEMRYRYHKLNDSPNHPFFGTFHAYCLKIINSDKRILNKLGYSKSPYVCSDEEQKVYIEKAEQLLNVKYTENAKTSIQKRNNELIEKNVSKSLIRDNKIVYGMMITSVLNLFKTEDPLILSYLTQYTHIIVDEFQDTDIQQVEFLNCFQNVNYFFVGDGLQAIYGFRGASSEFIKTLANTPAWTVIKLRHNYRSTKQIVEYANKFAKTYADDSYRVNMESSVNGIEVKELPQRGRIDGLNTILNELIPTLKKETNVALLFRTNKEANYASRYLHDKGLENGKTNFVEQTTKIINSTEDEQYFLSYLASFLYNNEYESFVRETVVNPKYGVSDFMKFYGKNRMIKSMYNKVLELRKIIKDNVDVINRVSQSLRITIPEYCKDINSILNFLHSYHKVGDVYCGTIHSVKGKEFDTVYVFGVNSYTFKITEGEELKNLFYVACTRARQKLVVYKC